MKYFIHITGLGDILERSSYIEALKEANIINEVHKNIKSPVNQEIYAEVIEAESMQNLLLKIR